MSKLDRLRSRVMIRSPQPSRQEQQQAAANTAAAANATVTVSAANNQRPPAEPVATTEQQQQQQTITTEPVVPQPIHVSQPDGLSQQPSGGSNVHSQGAAALVTGPPVQWCYIQGCTFTYTSTQVYQRHLNQMHPLPEDGRLSAVSHVSVSSEFGEIHPYPVSSILKYPDPEFEFPEDANASTFYSRTRSVAGLARAFKVQAKKFTQAFNSNGYNETKKKVFRDLKVRFKKLVEERMYAEQFLSPEQMDNPKYTDFLVSYETKNGRRFELCYYFPPLTFY